MSQLALVQIYSQRFNLTMHSGTHNLDVLAIDLDPQANLSQGLMHSDYSQFLLVAVQDEISRESNIRTF